MLVRGCHVMLFAVAIPLAVFFCCGRVAQEGQVYEEVDGLVAVEAEHFVEQTSMEIRRWYVVATNSAHPRLADPDSNHAAAASGGAYLEILPDTRTNHDEKLIRGENFSNQPGELGILHYKIFINNPGKYFVWVRAYSTGSEDNGIHMGLDGHWPDTGQRMQWCEGKHQWTWESKQRTEDNHCGEPERIFLEIKNPGEHTIMFSMREDGFEFDKFVLSRDYRKPEGIGPAERIRKR